jgi:PAS domain S-box-containing protein
MADTPTPTPHPDQPRAAILLVDDRPANLVALRAVLDDLGDLVEAQSGAEALERLGARAFAVVLLDIQMGGLDGFETARQLRARPETRTTPVIFLTAYEIDAAQLERGYALGAVDFLTKPVVPIVLRAKVAALVQLYEEKVRAGRQAEQYRLLVEGTRDYAIFMLDPEGRVATWNAGAERLKGYSAAEIVGRHFSTFYPPEAVERDWPAEELRRATADGRVEDEGWRVRKDGSRFWANVVITALRDATGTLRGFGKVTRDMTERREADGTARRLLREETARQAAEAAAEEARRERERLRVTLASIGDAVIATDAAGRVTFLNPVAEGLTGWGAAEAEGQPLERVFPIINEETRRPVENPVVKALREKSVVALANHTALVARGGAEVPIEDSAAPIRGTDGSISGVVMVFRDVTEARRAAEARLHLAAIVNSSDDAIIGKDLDGIVRSWNPAAERLYGYTAEEIVGQPLARLVPPEHPDELPTLMARLRRGERIEHYETERVRKDGSRVAVSLTISPIRDAEGRVVGASKIARDVTEVRRAAETRRLLAAIVESSDDAIIGEGLDGIVRSWNAAAERLYGYTADEAIGRPLAVLVPPDRLDELADIADRLRRGERVDHFETVRVCKDGRRLDVSLTISPIRDSAGRVVGASKIARDITAAKRHEAELRFLAGASAELAGLLDVPGTLRAVAELAVPHFADWCAVDLATPSGALERVAVAHADPAKVELARDLFRHYPPDPGAPGGAWAVFRTGRAELVPEVTAEALAGAARDDGHLRALRQLGLRSYMSVPLTARGRTAGVITFATAESGRRYGPGELRLAEDLARRAAVAVENARLYADLKEADRRKDEFLALLGHELRNPLAPIKNALRILELKGDDPAVVGRARAMIDRQATQLTRLVDELLDASRIARGKVRLTAEPLDLAALVRTAVGDHRHEAEAAGLAVELAAPPGPVRVRGDAARLTQVVTNLWANAIKFTPSGGRVSVRVAAEGADAVLTVSDTGVGIDPAAIPTLFQPFRQVDADPARTKGGLGLGLSVVRGLVELHGGRVEAASAGAGRGATFTVRLPLGAAAPAPAAVPAAGPAGGGRRVVIVEDGADAAESLRELLGLKGFEVTVAHTGPEGVELCRRLRPVGVVCDLGLPGMTGFDVARALRDDPATAGATLVAVSGYAQDEDRRRARAAGFDALLAKPADADELARLLAAPRPGSGGG